MSVELARRAAELMNGDGEVSDEELAEIFVPDVVMDFTVRVFNPKVYEGFAGLREFRADALEIWESLRFSDFEFVEGGDRVLVLNRVEVQGRGSGLTMESDSAGIWTLRDGRLAHFHLLASETADREKVKREFSGDG